MLDEILPHLDKVRGRDNNYTACCPVHGEKNPSMSLTEKDGKVLINCFACGANGLDVVTELGLSPSLLFRDKLVKQDNYLLNKTKYEDEMYVLIYDSAVSRGERPRAGDLKQYKVATKRNQQRSKLNL